MIPAQIIAPKETVKVTFGGSTFVDTAEEDAKLLKRIMAIV